MKLNRSWTLIATGLAKAFILGGSTVLALLISKIYGFEALGTFSVAMSAALLIGIFFRRGIPVIILRSAVLFPDVEHMQMFRTYLYNQLRINFAFVGVFALSAIVFFVLYFGLSQKSAIYFLLLLPTIVVGGVIQLYSVSNKVYGHPILASITEMGVVNIILLVIIAAVALLIDGHDIRLALIAIFAVFLVSSIAIFWFAPKQPAAPSVLDYSDNSKKIVMNAVLTFFYRNGYPLVFALFVSHDNLGVFRLEERFAFTITFIYSVCETMMMKNLIGQVGNATTQTEKLLAYLKYLPFFLLPAVAAAAIASEMVQIEWVIAMLGLDGVGIFRPWMFYAVPFYILILYNTLHLNLSGRHLYVTVNMIFTASALFISCYFLHSSMGLDGLRVGYFVTGVSGFFFSFVSFLYASKKFSPKGFHQ